MGRPRIVTPFGPSETLGVPCTTSPYMFRPNTCEIHVQPCHTFDIHWFYSPGLDATGDHIFCTRMYNIISACDRFYHIWNICENHTDWTDWKSGSRSQMKVYKTCRLACSREFDLASFYWTSNLPWASLGLVGIFVVLVSWGGWICCSWAVVIVIVQRVVETVWAHSRFETSYSGTFRPAL